MELSIILISLCLVISLSPLGCDCGIQQNPLNNKMEKDILDLHGYIVSIRTEMYHDRRSRDDLILRMNETIFRCYGKCDTTENKQVYDSDSVSTIKNSMHALQRGLREEKRIQTIMMSKIEALQKENETLNQALKTMNEDKTESMNMMAETLKHVNENLNKVLQRATEDREKMMVILTDIQNLKQENKDLNLALKDLNEKIKVESNAQLDIMSRIEMIQDENQNLSQALAVIKEAISFNKGVMTENAKPKEKNETLNQEMTQVNKVPEVMKKTMTEKCPSNILKKFLSDSSKTKAEYGNGETISVTCLADSGDSMYDYFSSDYNDNSVVLTCTDGKWIGHYPECFSNCTRPDIFATLDPEYGVYAPGDIVTVKACKTGNAPSEGDTTFTCMADGTWTGSARCPIEKKSCIEQPPFIKNTYVDGEVMAEYRQGTVLRYKCNHPFDQTGNHSVTCQDGRWIQDTSKLMPCTNKCTLSGIPGTLYSDTFSGVQVFDGLISSGRQIKVSCESGYFSSFRRSDVSMCVTGVWVPKMLPCEKIVSCATPNIPDVIVHPSKESYAVNESVSLTGCLNGLGLVGARSLLCGTDGSWFGDAQCTSYKLYLEKTHNTIKMGILCTCLPTLSVSTGHPGDLYNLACLCMYCQNGRTFWETTFNKRVITAALTRIMYMRTRNESECFKDCEKVSDCRTVYIIGRSSRSLRCMLFAESVRSKPEAFRSQEGYNDTIYNRLCNDECVVPKNLNGISLYNRDSPYYSENLPDGTVMSIKCKVSGLTAVPDQITCIGGKWDLPTEKVSCLR